jgi:hypothetical protein
LALALSNAIAQADLLAQAAALAQAAQAAHTDMEFPEAALCGFLAYLAVRTPAGSEFARA